MKRETLARANEITAKIRLLEEDLTGIDEMRMSSALRARLRCGVSSVRVPESQMRQVLNSVEDAIKVDVVMARDELEDL